MQGVFGRMVEDRKVNEVVMGNELWVGGEQEEEEVPIKRGVLPVRSIAWATSRIHSPESTSESEQSAYTLEDAYAVRNSKPHAVRS